MSDVSVQDEALRGGNVILNRKDGDCHDRQLSGTSKTERVGCVGRSDGAFTDDGEEDVTFHAALSDHDQEEKQRDCNMDQAAYRSALEIVEGRRGLASGTTAIPDAPSPVRRSDQRQCEWRP